MAASRPATTCCPRSSGYSSRNRARSIFSATGEQARLLVDEGEQPAGELAEADAIEDPAQELDAQEDRRGLRDVAQAVGVDLVEPARVHHGRDLRAVDAHLAGEAHELRVDVEPRVLGRAEVGEEVHQVEVTLGRVAVARVAVR